MPFSTTKAIVGATSLAASYVSSANGPAPDGRWQDWQFLWRNVRDGRAYRVAGNKTVRGRSGTGWGPPLQVS